MPIRKYTETLDSRVFPKEKSTTCSQSKHGKVKHKFDVHLTVKSILVVNTFNKIQADIKK